MGYYVYFLIDPRNNEVFYIGKGKGQRRFHHEVEARKGRRSRKCDRIRAILDAGLTPFAPIIERFTVEAEAYAREASLIAEIGLENLTNVLPGGIVERRFVLPKRDGRWTEAMFTKMVPSVARAMKLIAQTGGLVVCGQDMTSFCRELFQSLANDLGEDVFANALRPYGLDVRYASA
jgi:hypothetical protein